MRPYQFAEKYKVKLQTVYRWIKSGEIKSKKIILSVERIEIDEKAIPPKSYNEWKRLRKK